MVLACLWHKYQIPEVKSNSSAKLTGLVTIVKHLARQSKHPELLGTTQEDKALVDQFLEFGTRIQRASGNKESLLVVLKELDCHLSDRTYFGHHRISVADLLLFYVLHEPFQKRITFHEKEQIMNLSRWFNQMQHLKGVQQGYSPIAFQKTPLYS